MRASLQVVITVGFGLALAACGGHGGKATGDGGNGGGGTAGGDGGGTANGDGGGGSSGCVPVMCMQGKEAGQILQCGNCKDDDGDGKIDGADPECTGPCDNSEANFSTGIPGDNQDPKWQDCFFDGDSGSGNDGCCYHTCCLLGYTAQQCADAGIDKNFDPATECPKGGGTTTNGNCNQTTCQNYCQQLTPPGCDCFGCCTVCNGTDCKDVEATASCSADKIDDPSSCTQCTKSTVCNGGACGGDTCVLCPGQDASDLPPSCGSMNACPASETTCTTSADCTTAEYCNNGCCVVSAPD